MVKVAKWIRPGVMVRGWDKCQKKSLKLEMFVTFSSFFLQESVITVDASVSEVHF